jgi:tol-pal system protein YbgF
MHWFPRNAGPAAVGVPMRLYSVALLVLLGMLGLGSPLAQAESTSKRVDDLTARLQHVEQILENQSLVEMAQRLDESQSKIRVLEGKIEELENQVQQLKKKQAALAAAPPPPPPAPAAAPAAAAGADAASGAAPAAAPAAAAAAKPAPAADADVSVDQTVYLQAMDALKAQSYSTAQIGFKNFVATYPTSPLAPNAQFWLGKTYQTTSQLELAAAAFRKVLSQWPDDAKAPYAMLDLGLTLIDLKKTAEGRAQLVQCTQKYPGTDAAKQAADRLAHLGKAK